MAKFILSAFADEAGDSLSEQIAALKENEIRLIEPRSFDKRNVITLSNEELLSIRVALDEAGIKVGSLGSPIGKFSIDEDFDAQLESLETQMAEADFMIELSPDSLIRNLVANEIYGHYVDSPVMGAENVAVHVFDRWFSDGKVRMDSEVDFLNARMFAEFNRSSLIGKEAPSLVMEAMDGSVKELFTSGKPGKYHVLFFYDTACSKCKVETILLRNHVAVEPFPVEYHAIYAG